MRDDRERLLDIQEAIGQIQKYAERGRSAFDSDELIQTWIVHHLQIIGEAARGLSSEFCDRQPEIPWAKIVGMRNILVHNYFGVDKEAMWGVVQNDLQDLKQRIGEIIQLGDGK